MVKAIKEFIDKLTAGLASAKGVIEAGARSIDNAGGMIRSDDVDQMIKSFISDKLLRPNDEWERTIFDVARAIFDAAATETGEYCLNTILTETDDFDLDREAASVEQDLKLDEMKFLDFNVQPERNDKNGNSHRPR